MAPGKHFYRGQIYIEIPSYFGFYRHVKGEKKGGGNTLKSREVCGASSVVKGW